MRVTTRDEHDLQIILNAEYWTSIIYVQDRRYREEHKSFIDAANSINELVPNRALIYAVKHPNDAAVAGFDNGTWRLHKLRGLQHPLEQHFIDGICSNASKNSVKRKK